MFVTSHIAFGQPSKFVGGSLEVIRTIRNNKLHFTWGCSILLLKKKKRALRPDSFFFFFSMILIFLKYFNSNHNLPSYSLFSNCFLRFFYLGVHRGTSVFSWFFFHSSSRVWLALVLASHLPPFDGKTLKIVPVLQNQASSMKLRVNVFLFLVFLHIKMDGKNKLFFLQAHQHSDKEVFLGVGLE